VNQEIRFGDIELAVVNRVRARLTAMGDPVQVGTVVPSTRPGRFVVIRRTGGPASEFVVTEWPQITVEAWGATPKQAHDLAQVVRSVIRAMPGQTLTGITVYRVDEFSGPANLPDPESTQSRYTWTVSLHVRAATVADVPA
jgi:hypothetical protein